MSIKLNGSSAGSVSFDAPADTSPTGTDVTLTLPTSAGSANQVLVTNGSGTLSWESRMTAAGPAFSAYNSSAQSLGNGVFTKLQFPTEEFDTASSFDSSTNYRFTPTVAGYYQFTACINVNAPSGILIVSFYKNGSEFKRGTQMSLPNASVQPNSTALIYLNGSTDFVEAYGYQDSGSTRSTTGTQAEVYFQGFLARPA